MSTFRCFNDFEEFKTYTKLDIGSVVDIECNSEILGNYTSRFRVMILGADNNGLIFPEPIGYVSFFNLVRCAHIRQKDKKKLFFGEDQWLPLGVEE